MNASDPIQTNHETHKQTSHTVRVRMGKESWTLSNSSAAREQTEPILRVEPRQTTITLAAMRARIAQSASQSPTDSRFLRLLASIRQWVLPEGEGRFRAGLKTGLATGMMLGSLALVGFHQLAAPVSAVGGLPAATRVSPASVAPGPSSSIPYPGLSATLAVPVRRSGASAWLALTPVGMAHWFHAARLRPSDYRVQAIRLRAGQVTVQGVVSQGAVRQASDALALAESALLTSISWAADGGRQVDAARALQNALAVPPSVWSSWPGGGGQVAVQLRTALQAMLASVRRGDPRRCEMQAVEALDDWLKLCGRAGVMELSKMGH
ncbi:hypothetical protein [Alicyclobacillus vulcanalis]|uniref:Uncharacterized protein n=1 Tax=Alicyclobacillus vulcanalis TaxID=252246 RepID=A0A1N7KQL4_9BACL|nr:hypothetical protein [Alicyclobacillus vulcanalis]SIS63831.1 hypothetical protein SAMN05421799_102113 [Alicyclobacillus vulcanalis]